MQEAARSEDWHKMLLEKNVQLYIIGHEHFHKSMTMDVENRLMLFLSSVGRVDKVHNKRENLQKKYYMSEEFDPIYQKIWEQLGCWDRELFPEKKRITDASIFSASPFHKLRGDQTKCKYQIIDAVRKALDQDRKQLIMVEGDAGTGKTVLNSHLFYELCTFNEEYSLGKIKCHLLVNHEEQLLVCKRIAQKLKLENGQDEIVCNPTRFINQHSEDEPVDVVLIDEAHLLWSQGKQAYVGEDQLVDIRNRAKVTIIMFDESQILRIQQYREQKQIEKLKNESGNIRLELKEQLRINAGKETINWIRAFTKEQRIDKIPKDEHYEIKIFQSPEELQKAIVERAKNEETQLSRVLATFDWEYKGKRRRDDGEYWKVEEGNWSMPWNKQLRAKPEDQRKNANLAWAEKSYTIDEVGSTFTIQGFDLNFAGVILGPSVIYKNGKIDYDPALSKNQNATRTRTLWNGEKKKFGRTLIKNEVNVLMTRGVDWLYIYACDPELRKALKQAQQ